MNDLLNAISSSKCYKIWHTAGIQHKLILAVKNGYNTHIITASNTSKKVKLLLYSFRRFKIKYKKVTNTG
jgi:hypothetical protein